MFSLFKKKAPQEHLRVPFAGEVVSLDQVPDRVFAERMVGDGFAIQPEGDSVLVEAPVAGELAMIFPTGHAFGIRTSSGYEVLVHLGLDTVELDGEGFEVLAEVGQTLEAGDPIIRMDCKYIREAHKLTLTPVILSDATPIQQMEPSYGHKNRGELALTLHLKD